MSSNRAADAAGFLRFFRESFDFETASDEDLRYLGRATDFAETLAIDTADALAGTSYFIGEEHQNGREVKQINGVDVAIHLMYISDAMRVIGEMSRTGDDAKAYLAQRLAAKAKLSSKRARTVEDSSKEHV
jgi:hypothetical protein